MGRITGGRERRGRSQIHSGAEEVRFFTAEVAEVAEAPSVRRIAAAAGILGDGLGKPMRAEVVLQAFPFLCVSASSAVQISRTPRGWLDFEMGYA